MRFRFGDYEVDGSRFVLTRRGHPVAIEPRPLRLLIHLLERHPEAVSKDALLDALWPGTAVTEGSLTRAVGEVRRALRERADEPGTIRTVRGRGYAIGRPIEQIDAAGAPPEKTHRQLVALLSADAVGYSRLLGEDEAATVQGLEDALERMGAAVVERGGAVIDTVGDNLLARFPSAVDAVSAALTIQESLRGRRLPFRIGIHLGEVLESEGRLYGDAVNVVARLERLAAPGGLCVSEVVAGEVRGRLDVDWVDAGEQQLKNIVRPVRAYRTGGDVAPTLESRSAPAPSPVRETPSLVVLPFHNLTGNPEREFIADGLTEELTTALSRNPHVMVISRTSAFSYKSRAARIDDVVRELGVRYVLEGSMRESPSRLRFTLQLIDAEADQHLWAESFDAGADAIQDLIALQAEMADRVLASLGSELVVRERARRHAPSADPRAYEAVLRGWPLFATFRRAEAAEAARLFARAAEIDPDYASAHALVAAVRAMEYAAAWRLEPEVLDAAEASARRAVELDPEHPDGLAGLAYVNLVRGALPQAARYAQRALELNPNLDGPYAWLSQIAVVEGDFAGAAHLIKQALRVNPIPDTPLYSAVAMFEYQAGRRDEAVAILERQRESNPDATLPRLVLLSHYTLLGPREKAHRILAEVRAISPGLTAEHAATLIIPGRSHVFWRALEAVLRVAGLP